jgi:hypothetical protein
MAISFRSTPTLKIQPNASPADRCPNGLIFPAMFFRAEASTTEKAFTLDGTLKRYEDGRYAPYLESAGITVEGELGMLTRAEVKFIVERDADFEAYTSAFLVPNQKVTLYYGWRSPYPGWGTNGQQNTLRDMVIYDFSFEYASDTQRYICSFKAMAATATLDEVEFAIQLPEDKVKNFKFLTENWAGRDKSNPVTSFTELILAQSQTKTGDPGDVPQQPVVYKAPADNAYVVTVKFTGIEDDKSMAGEDIRVYVNLNYIVNYIINQFILPYHTSTSQAAIQNVQYKLQESIDISGVPLLFSPNPLEVVFPAKELSLPKGVGVYNGSTYKTNDDRSAAAKGVSFDNAFIEGFTECINGTTLTLGNILISLDALVDIQKQVADIKDQKSKAESTDESSRSNTLLSLKDFIKKISALINKNSGGLIDLVIYHPEIINGNPPNIMEIVDRNYRGKVETATPLEFNNRYPGDGVSLTSNLKAEVPKDAVAMNAYLNNLKGISADLIQNGKTASTEARSKRARDYFQTRTKFQNKELHDMLVKNGFDEESIQTAARAVRQYIQNRPLGEVYKHGNSSYPLKLALTVAGVHGFKFGDLITLKYMPRQYKESVCFRVLRQTHKFEGMNWTTELETVCDLL